MYCVELKVLSGAAEDFYSTMFLMYRVELKVTPLSTSGTLWPVPNVPCGVESPHLIKAHWPDPYGFLMYRVELKVIVGVGYYQVSYTNLFLMYRVELKDSMPDDFPVSMIWLVPNVPCGVESRKSSQLVSVDTSFLMYRVELKAFFQHRLRGFVVCS